MRYELYVHNVDRSIFIIYDTIKTTRSRSWYPINLVFSAPINYIQYPPSTAILMASFDTIPTYEEFIILYPELFI